MSGEEQVVSIGARPEALAIDLSRTAVLVIDMQNDFGAKGGMFDRAGIDITGIGRAVAPTARALSAARARGIPVIYLAKQHRPDLADMGDEAAPNRIKHGPLGGVAATAAGVGG